MKLTKAQIIAKQEITPSGWSYDWKYAVIHGEHTAVKSIDIDGDGTRIIQARCCYSERYDYMTKSKTITPKLSVMVYHKSSTVEGIYTAYGLGSDRRIGEDQPTKNYKKLCNFAANVDDQTILQMAGIAQINENRTLFESVH